MARVTALRSVALQPHPGGAVARQIAAFMGGFSIEATRLQPADLEALRIELAPGSRVYLTAVPHSPVTELVEAAVRVRAAGFEPVPHLAVRNLASAQAFASLLSRLTLHARVRRALVVSGDRDQPAGPFASTLEAIESGLLQRHGIAEIGIAGYPEGHPRIPEQALERALLAKVEAASQTGLAVHIVTQFAFDARAILRWITRLRAFGVEAPVRIGIAGPTSIATLLRYAQRCGVRASAQTLARQAGLIKHLVGTSAPDGVVRALAEAGELGRVTPHFYSFGGVAPTARWVAAAAAGRIVPRVDGFSVEPP